MLDINLIRTDPKTVKKGISAKGADPELVDRFLVLDESWRKLTQEINELRAEQKKLSAERKIEEAKVLKEKIQTKEAEEETVGKEREIILRQMPNIPLDEVPSGKDGSKNVVLREEGEKIKFDFLPKDYLTLAEELEIIDVERAAKVSGSRFGYLKGMSARLEFALVQFAFLEVMKKGFTPIVPPVLIKKEMMEGMGFIGMDDEEVYFLRDDELVLVGTSEQSIGPMFSGEILEDKELPKRFAAFSTCFRREAGSYGKDTKGILRVHQFDKVELFSFTRSEDSQKEHEMFLEIEESLMRALAIPYRVVQLCSGDLSRPSAATYDIEAWMPGQNDGKGEYRETHSTSNTTDFQARRLNIRYRTKLEQENHFVHMVNGTAFAIGRILIAIFENYQTKEGTIRVPEVLQKWVDVKL